MNRIFLYLFFSDFDLKTSSTCGYQPPPSYTSLIYYNTQPNHCISFTPLREFTPFLPKQKDRLLQHQQEYNMSSILLCTFISLLTIVYHESLAFVGHFCNRIAFSSSAV